MKKKLRLRRNNHQFNSPTKSRRIIFPNRLSLIAFLAPVLLLPLLSLLFIILFPFEFTKFKPKTMSEYFASMKSRAGKSKIQVIDFKDEREKASYFRLKIDELFWKNRVELAQGDSMYLSIDLPDSIIILELNGVPLRQCKIEEYKITPLYSQLKFQPQFLEWLNDPFILLNESATISKMPIKEVIAPKDTIEAMKQLSKEIEIEQEDVQVILGFNRDLILEFKQAEPPTLMGRFEMVLFKTLKNITAFVKDFYSLLSLKSSSQDFWIKIKISQNDAKAIYRALPREARVVLRF